MTIQSTVRDILKKKSTVEIFSIEPKATVFEALKRMAIHNVGALLVIREGILVGIVSERDYARKVILSNRTSRNTLVSEIMSSKVYYALIDDTAEQCLSVMSQKHVRHLPVYDHNKIIGVISMGDVVSVIITDKQFELDTLLQYVTGPVQAALWQTVHPLAPRMMTCN